MSHVAWPSRPLLMALLLGCSAYAIYHLLDNSRQSASALVHWRLSCAAAIAVFSIGFGLCAVRKNISTTMAFSLALGLIAGGIGYWRLFIHWPYVWNFWSLGLALLIITPFFQAQLAERWNNYRELHKQAWGNAVVLLLSLVFTGISFGMAHLLANLFDLIGIKLLRELLREDYVNWVLAGVSFGGAMGVLREHDNIIDATQRLVESVLSLLTLPLSLALVAFIATLPFTGLEPLWEATRSTSPIVFACVLGSILLLNAVIRDTDSDITAGFVIKLSARALALVIAPLAAIAVVSISTRVQQYGWTPDRLWAALICVLLLAYGLLYLAALLPGAQWMQRLRNINLALALLTSGIALLLSTPLLDFGALSTRDQLQRLQSGQVDAEHFDAVALAFDFGPAGRAALESLDTSENELLAAKVEAALNSDNRWQASRQQGLSNSKQALKQRLVVQPENLELDETLLSALKAKRVCDGDYCYFLMDESGVSGTAISHNCGRRKLCELSTSRYELCDNGWQNTDYQICNTEQSKINAQRKDKLARQDQAGKNGEIEIREVTRRQVFVGGEPVGEMFD